MDELLYLDEPSTVGERPTVARCRCCHRLLTENVSLGYRIGPVCRRRLGITPRRAVRITGVPRGWDIVGQADLLESDDHWRRP